LVGYFALIPSILINDTFLEFESRVVLLDDDVCGADAVNGNLWFANYS
jgi:hypothetical protein